MFSTAQAGGEARGGGAGGGGGFNGHDSPYFTSGGANSTTSTPSQHESHFDPHDPAWFTPSIPPSSSSTHLPQTGFSSAEYPNFVVEGEGECEVLADGFGVEGYDLTGMRRYSEGDGQSVYSHSSSSSSAPDRTSFLKSSIYSDMPSTGFFDSEYTLAPSAALSSTYSDSSPGAPSLHSSSAYSQSQPSYPSTASQTPAHEQPSYPTDVEMTFSPTSAFPSDPAPWSYDYSQPSTRQASYGLGGGVGDDLGGLGGETQIVETQQNGAYSLNVVSTTQTFATINYSASPTSVYPPGPSQQSIEPVPFPSSSSSSSSIPPSEALFSAPSARSSTSSGVLPSPFITQSGTSSACTSVHPTPALQPSPFISNSAFTSASPAPGKQRSSLSGPTTSTGTPRRARRPSLAHAHTQAAPELSVIHQGQEQLLDGVVINTSPARHHSFSGPTPSLGNDGGGGLGSYPSGTASATVCQGGFSPYPSRHHHHQQQQQHPPQSPYARRRSSNHSLSASAGPSAASPVSVSATGRRISCGPGGVSTAPGTPTRLVLATEGRGSRTSSPAQGLAGPFPTTPTRRSFGGVASSPATTPHRASPASGGSARRNNLNLTISVDAASSLSPSRAGSGRAGSTSLSNSPSPYSPFSPSHPPPLSASSIGASRRRESAHSISASSSSAASLSAYPYPPPLASPSASRKRRFSADVATTGSLALAQAQLRQQEEMVGGTSGSSLAGYAGGAGGGGGLKGLATTFEEDQDHQHYLALAQQSQDLDRYTMHHPQTVHLGSSLGGGGGVGGRAVYAPSPAPTVEGFGTPYQPQQQQYHALDAHAGQQHQQQQDVALDGTVGLGLEMGVEEMHLYSGPPPDGVAPAAFVAAGSGAGMAYDFASHQQQQQHQPFLHHSHSQPQLSHSSSSSSLSLGYYPQHQHVPPPSQQPLSASTTSAFSDVEDSKRRLEDEIRTYLRSENRLELGEKTVVVMSPKIAQRSYGTEKRLLAPPPMALLLGSSWWTTLDSHPSLTHSAAHNGKLPSPPSPLRRTTLPPEVFISISTDKDPLKHSASMNWMAPEGKLVLERDEEDAPPVSGRAVSKSLAVSVPGELNKDVSTTVRTVVSIAEPGTGDVAGRVWAMVPGRPITVISKPSKKKAIPAGAVAGLTHGTLVSLYNRTKTYTGSTRYLCTSGLQSMFPLTDWSSMAGESAPRAFAPNDIRDVRFTSKSTAWDAFIIYAVDLDPDAATREPPKPLHETYPKPPASAIPLDKDNPKPLYYNQTIVLQDLSTGVVSPILIIRRCDAKAVAVGGGSIDDLGPNPSDVANLPVAPGEQLGEPVSQYRPIALEVFQNISRDRSENAFEGKLPDDVFLGIADDEVGVHPAQEKRTYVRSPTEAASQPITPTTPRSFAEMENNQSTSADSAPVVPKTEPIDAGLFVDPADPAAKMKRPRRTSSSNAVQTSSASSAAAAAAAPSRPPGTLAKSRKRGQSLTGLPQLGTAGFRGKKDSAKIWTIPVGDHCVWSIVNVEVGRHTMYIPPSVEGGKPPSLNPSSMHNPLYSVPRPFTRLGPHMPTVFSVEWPAEPVTSDFKGMIAINGENLSQDLSVWVGDTPSPFPAVLRSPHLLLFQPPPVSSSLHSGMHFLPVNTPAATNRISLVRDDGVVFLTPHTLPERPAPSSPAKLGRTRRR